ncbi:serine hydrolase domain-containing protein [Legionella anisa]|uniref:Serine hydrolase n=2 Tax=Legionella anisa TaxID=28082 RepID=A0AAX0WRB2_9GAMM|nr:serine hydrolase domain-containing protein [Legionella anisa]AWN74840.1 serine hydrolase [Legionella anisa]KTC77712.1 serine-type D-Ala-D-Ala carboxypeptidase [Legionella anisa]MCW8424959.1 beta-lactamase family protein [Legionella anisa]MCW8445921.1 beta-lactamase family protein [Legionella anisa]PNL61202.1 serine hydrolase [Legionella anisa]
MFNHINAHFMSTTAQLNKMVTVQFWTIFQSYFNSGEPGGAALVVKDNRIIYMDGFGLADMKTKQPINTKTLFNVGSISKTFVAYGILKLAQERKLSLDDDLYQYFTDFKNTGIAKKVKLYHLLTHTSGIPDSRPVKEQHDFYLTAKDEENFAPLKQTDALQFEPGTQYRYSNPAFNGLALIIEKVTGKKWQQYISENIYKPAEMKTSTITDGPHPETGVSHGYVLNDKKEFEELDYGEEPTFAAAGNGGVWSSVEELWNYEQAIQQHKFLPVEWIDKSRTPYPFPDWKDEIPQRLGLSWFINKDSMGHQMIGHTGAQGGFISDYCWWPEEKIFYVLLCNIPKPIQEIRKRVYEAAKMIR